MVLSHQVPMNYATGQMASVVRLVNTDPNWPVSQTVRTVPLLQRGAWRPWPWRLWGGPSLAYGRSLADYPAMQPYTFENYPPYLDPYPEAYPYAYPYEGYDGSPGYDVGQAPASLSAAAQALIASIHANAPHSQPPAWKPTYDFQGAFNFSMGPLGGLGTQARPELLKLDGIYGKRTEMALAKVVGGLDKLMNTVYSTPSSPPSNVREPSSFQYGRPEASAGYGTGQHLDIVGPSIHRYRASGTAPRQSSILAGTTIDPRLGAAIQQLGTMLLGRPGIVAIADAQNAIDVFVLQSYIPMIRAYVDNVLMGTFMGFPITVRPSGPIYAQ